MHDPSRAPAPTPQELDALVDGALAEDAVPAAAWPAGTPRGDVTSENALPPGVEARARLVAKAAGRLAGLDVFARVFERCDPKSSCTRHARDGDALEPGQVVAEVRGEARALLRAERTALNFVQHLSGVATLTARYVAAVAGRARILDTRKTTPGLRALEKAAVRAGGGENHRFGLFDEAMLKNNHVDLAGRPLDELVRSLRAALGPGTRITAEARDTAEALAAVAGGADVVLLDNMTPAHMADLCPRLREAAGDRALELEASGGVTLDSVATIAATGVDRISVGALTHSVRALDLSLSLERGR